MNEKGSTTLYGCICLLLISLWGFKLIEAKIYKLRTTEAKMQLALCSKKVNGELSSLSKVINLTNDLLATLTVSQYASVAIPWIGAGVAVSINRAIQLLKIYQDGRVLWILNSIYGSKATRKCLDPRSLILTPYKSKRDALNQKIAKKKKFKYRLRREKWEVKTTLNTQSSQTKSKMKKGWFSLNSF